MLNLSYKQPHDLKEKKYKTRYMRKALSTGLFKKWEEAILRKSNRPHLISSSFNPGIDLHVVMRTFHP